jgi:hypothetical protein
MVRLHITIDQRSDDGHQLCMWTENDADETAENIKTIEDLSDTIETMLKIGQLTLAEREDNAKD